ncbi:MAG: sigma-54 dependent transcriptional regulator, partial [Bacteroidales bacterium]|nr:sigma-54 dependent transcriptional regulator [Bacteroidales bacterium]
MKQKGNILIVDDNKSILKALEMLLKHKYTTVKAISNPNLIISEIQQNHVDVVLLDMNFSAGLNTGNEGLYWLGRILEEDSTISIVMITAYGDVDLAVKALKKGATDFVLKPWDNQKILATIQAAHQLSNSRREVTHLKEREQSLISAMSKDNKEIIGNSLAIKKVLNMVEKVATTDANILITGENGTGKEVITKEIHRLSNRAKKALITVDMGAISETLFESELFGHKKGAFTDAKEDRTGKMETASGGTLFLDEIGNLPLPLQSKMLTALQDKSISRIGDNKRIPIDFRLVCATNSNLTEMVEDGKFREDLLYRINTIHIELPPLRERGEDIIDLAHFFMDRFAQKYQKENATLSSKAKEKLMQHNWPGNIRELQHAIEKAIILSDKKQLTDADFYFQRSGNTSST